MSLGEHEGQINWPHRKAFVESRAFLPETLSVGVLCYLLIEQFSLLTRVCEWPSCKFARCRFMMKSAALICLKCALSNV